MNFPIFKTKIGSIDNQEKVFNLSDPRERKQYFELKAGPEIKKIRDYLKDNTFIAYLLGKKNSGKGTYSKLFIEAVGADNIIQLSIGDLVRKVHQSILEDEEKKKELINFLEKNYRGYIPVNDVMDSLLNRSTKTLLPTEFILALLKKEISTMQKKAVFIDGFPRDLDQVSYSLFFRDLIGYREDPDIFILIDVPENVIDERIKYRVVCPKCHTPRNLKLLATKEVGFDETTGKFYLICDNPDCENVKMIQKEGDEQGIEPIRERLQLDEKLMNQAISLYGISKVLLRNSVPADIAEEYVDKYEITPEYQYEWDKNNKKVKIIEKSWMVKDSEGVASYSLMPPPVVVSMIKQIVNVLGL